MSDAVDKYIYVKTKDNEYYGNLLSFIDGQIELEVKDKNRTKKIIIDYDKIKHARYAVEF